MKKKIIKFILYAIPTFFVISLLFIVCVLVFYLDPELIDRLVIINVICQNISAAIMIYGLNKIGFVTDEINNKFKKCKFYKTNIKDFKEFQKQFEYKIKKLNYNTNKFQLNEYEFVNFYINKDETNLTMITLIRVTEYNKKEYDKILKISQDFIESIYGDNEINEYVKVVRVLCVDKMTTAFKEFVLEGIYLDINSETLPVGISFGSKKLFIKEKKKSIFDFHNEYQKQEEFKNLVFKLIDVDNTEKTLNKK
ncbi:MAG: hypothetical protein E7161_01210 [Firmicutes bacterium]|nr:hypothetical protein [Bacillota bacterium]